VADKKEPTKAELKKAAEERLTMSYPVKITKEPDKKENG
jgi:hypothetical protein